VHWYVSGMFVSSSKWIDHRPLALVDNAVMIAWASMHRFLARDYDSAEAQPRKKWSIEDIEDGK